MILLLWFCLLLVTLNLPLTQCNNPERKKELKFKSETVIYSTIVKSPTTPPPPPPPPVQTVFIAETKDNTREQANSVLSALLLKAQLKETSGQVEKAQPITRRTMSPPLPPPPTEDEVLQATFPKASVVQPEFIPEQVTERNDHKSPIMEDTVVRMRNSQGQKSRAANDRRSYVEKSNTPMKVNTVDVEKKMETDQEEVEKKKCCAKPQNIANDLIDGKHPVCCVCDIKITRYAFSVCCNELNFVVLIGYS